MRSVRIYHYFAFILSFVFVSIVIIGQTCADGTCTPHPRQSIEVPISSDLVSENVPAVIPNESTPRTSIPASVTDKCANAKFLIVRNSKHLFGLGTQMYHLARISALATANGRILVVDDEKQWKWADVDFCPEEDRFSRECWFAPLTECFPIDSIDSIVWDEYPSVSDSNKHGLLRSDFTIVTLECPNCLYLAEIDLQEEVDLADQELVDGVSEVSDSFSDSNANDRFLVEAAMRVTRLNAPTSEIVDLVLRSVFEVKGASLSFSQRVLPRSLVSVFIERRSFDRWGAALLPVDSYMTTAFELAHRHNISDIYIGSDSSEVLLEVINVYGGGYRLHSLPALSGFDMSRGNKVLFDDLQYQKSGSVEYIVLSSFADLRIHSESDFFVGAPDSDYSRLIGLLREGNGIRRKSGDRAIVTSSSPDKASQAIWRPQDSLPFDPEWDFSKFAASFECKSLVGNCDREGAAEKFLENAFEVSEMIETQRFLQRMQNPSDCDLARILILQYESQGGLGSTILHRADWMGRAVAENRTLLLGNIKPCKWAETVYCRETDFGSQDCFFRPLSSCDPNWPTRLFRPNSNSDQERIKVVCLKGVCQEDEKVSDQEVDAFDQVYVPPFFEHKDPSWWRGRASVYNSRPNARTVRAVERWQRKTFPPDGIVPHPIISLSIPIGDKFGIADYMMMISPIAKQNNITNIYLGTNDQQIIEEAVRSYAGYKFYYISHAHTDSLDERTVDERLRESTFDTNDFMLALADLYIQIQGDVFVGTKTSNRCQLIDSWRKFLGKSSLPYFSPQITYLND